MRLIAFILLLSFGYQQAAHGYNKPIKSPAKKLLIGLNHIPGVMDMNNSDAPYNKLLLALDKHINIKLAFEFYTIGRSSYLLEHGKIDCLFPVGAGAYPREFETEYSEHINSIKTHLFSLNSLPYSSLESLENKTIVYQQGFQFGGLVKTNPFNITFVPVVNQQAALALLKNARAEAFLDYMPDLKLAIGPEEFNKLSFDSDNPIQTYDDVFECLTSDAANLTQLNDAIITLKRSGELKSILGEHYNL